MTMDDANALLSPGFSVQNPYDSTQLPTTGASLYTKDPSTVKFETGGIEGINSGQSTQRLTKDLFAAGGAVEFKEPNKDVPSFAAIEATQTEGGANLVQSGAIWRNLVQFSAIWCNLVQSIKPSIGCHLRNWPESGLPDIWL